MSIIDVNTLSKLNLIGNKIEFNYNIIGKSAILILYINGCPMCDKIKSSSYEISTKLNSKENRGDGDFINLAFLNVNKFPRVVEIFKGAGYNLTSVPDYFWVRDNFVKNRFFPKNIIDNPKDAMYDIIELYRDDIPADSFKKIYNRDEPEKINIIKSGENVISPYKKIYISD